MFDECLCHRLCGSTERDELVVDFCISGVRQHSFTDLRLNDWLAKYDLAVMWCYPFQHIWQLDRGRRGDNLIETHTAIDDRNYGPHLCVYGIAT